MQDKIYHSEKLNKKFKIKKNNRGENVVVFEDQVNYSQSEMKKIKDCDVVTMKNIHEIKLVFEGVVL